MAGGFRFAFRADLGGCSRCADAVATVVGPIRYAPGECWFRRAITVEGLHGTMFSDRGDSGAVILKEGTGEVVGLLFAGNGADTFACPIDAVLTALNCVIA
jgi:hypothetical protein